MARSRIATATPNSSGHPHTREAVLQIWEDGWARVFAAPGAAFGRRHGARHHDFCPAHSVMEAINRQSGHAAIHRANRTAREALRPRWWQSLGVPKNKSAEFNRKVTTGESSQR